MVTRGSWIVWSFLPLCLALFAGCQSYRHTLQRGQGYYEQNQYEMALAVFRHLEADQNSLSEADLVRYCYLRGMTDFRLGYRDDARYWLGLSKAAQLKGAHTSLQEDEQRRLETTLGELNREAYGDRAPAPESEPEDACKRASDCAEDMFCQDSRCVPLVPGKSVE